MLFSSTVFITGFLPLLLLAYFLVPSRFLAVRNGVLLGFSLLFYSFGGVRYTALLLLSAALHYVGGLLVSRGAGRMRKFWLILFVSASLLLLLWFKYAGFLASLLPFRLPLSLSSIVLPLGISFYTFQGLSYLIDVYRRDCPVQKNPLLVLLYITLFPQLIAGPIVNYGDVAAELSVRRSSLRDISDGLTRFLFGFAKKMLLAGAMGEVADGVFGLSVTNLPTSAAWVGGVAYAFQIYYDFSGYSDMAIGLGQVFGFRFPENFRYPYMADSITDFWRRWHITLSRWFRNYVYIPLGGNRCSLPKQIRNLLVVWLLTGLWHGADWSFLLWGLYYGVWLILEKFVLDRILYKGRKPDQTSWSGKVVHLLRRLGTLLVVLVGWIFFRAESLSQAAGYLRVLFTGGAASLGQAEYYLRQYWPEFAGCVVASFPLLPTLRRYFSERETEEQQQLQVQQQEQQEQQQKQLLMQDQQKQKQGEVQETSSMFRLSEKLFASLLFLLSYMKLVTGSFNPFIYFHF